MEPPRVCDNRFWNTRTPNRTEGGGSSGRLFILYYLLRAERNRFDVIAVGIKDKGGIVSRGYNRSGVPARRYLFHRLQVLPCRSLLLPF